ncbi:unnamed protein product [Phytophthora lilii]|uniref:protein-tyrosine-phosphatase n=1 Tax=Phytophthora lilii TaxID=2077276 RepID=A0A9W6UDM5_9STRA|nr:unnamed protein product [Phytophthora lilii]
MSMRKAPGLRLQTSVVQDNVPVEIAARLFVGSIHAAFNIEVLKSNKISHVLNLAGSYATFPEDFTYLSLSIRDKEYASLLSCLPVAAVFIDAGLKNGGVLVHCAGGRSRSPAVAMAFLMMKQQMSYSTISAHVKALRPVVSLNVGFDAQLRCLETAQGDVFVANQHLLKARLTRLAQQHEDGDLVGEIARKRRQSHQASSQSPPPLVKKQSSFEMLASGCDERGMVGERVPSGFCLSLPPGSSSSKVVSGSSFIPALRSMGTVFGCQCCGESLFCAGAIVHHHDMVKLSSQTHTPSVRGDSRFLDSLRGQSVSNTVRDFSIDKEQVIIAANENVSKRPLLAKLRLSPHSPSVTMGNGSGIISNTGISTIRRKSASPVLWKPSHGAERLQKGEEESDTESQSSRRPATEESKRTSSTSLSPNKTNGELKKKSGSGLWHSLTSFISSRRTAKASTEARTSHHEEPKSLALSQTPAHSLFLKRNAMDWHRSVRQLVNISKSDSCQTISGSTVDQVAALVDQDSRVLGTLNDCKQWFVDPQVWTINQVIACPQGELRCPRDFCGAVVGEWRWEGLRYVGSYG